MNPDFRAVSHNSEHLFCPLFSNARSAAAERIKRIALSGWPLAGPGAILQSIMGDKSPKATNKKAAQKQAKANTNMQKKSDATAAKQVVKAKTWGQAPGELCTWDKMLFEAMSLPAEDSKSLPPA